MAARSERIDALRGLAVFGILLVNLWGFVHGFSLQRLPIASNAMALADQLIVGFVTAFAEQKFYPVFSFLFGAGFALQTGRRRAPGPALDAVRTIYLRRVRWLLVCGLLHGSLIWMGDILTAYAVLGFWLVQFAGVRLASLWRALWLAIALNGVIVLLYGTLVSEAAYLPLEDAISGFQEAYRLRAVYTEGGWVAIAHERLREYGSNLSGFWIILPRVAMLFLFGAVATRMGWLTRPWRHRRLWRRVLLLALTVGLPLNLWAGWVAVQSAIDPFVAPPLAGPVTALQEVMGPLLGAGYVAAFMLARGTLAPWLAPVGRMALTNYLMQSLVLMLTLQGFALGWGGLLGYPGLMLLALAIMTAQTVFSHWWMARHAMGPMETVWRRYTYRVKSALK